jgi:hypothetical protein
MSAQQPEARPSLTRCRVFHVGPAAGGEAEPHALPGLALAADDLADQLELLRHALVGGHDLVEGVGDLAFDAEVVGGHPHREVAAAHRLQGMQQLLQGVGRSAAIRLDPASTARR